jgi:glycogen operon protein
MINAHGEDLLFTIQDGEAGDWRRVVDTSRPSPEDILEAHQEAPLDGLQYLVKARSIVVLRRERG